MGILKLTLPQHAEDGLARLAERAGASAEAVASEAIERFVAEELSTIEGIERALEDVRQGRLVPHEQARSEINSLLDRAERRNR
jgi:predicted transcriptional regulator